MAQRGRGWRVRYPVGSADFGPGLPLVNAERWDAGVQLRLGREPLSLALAVTQGTLCYPRVSDDNDGKQVSLRLAWTPSPALVAGVSGAVGEFLAREVQDVLPASAQGTYRQEAAGLDLQWSHGYWIVRAEAVWSRWTLPALDATRIEEPLDALGLFAEARYKLRPGLYLAARAEHLGFSELPSAVGLRTWDAPVTRVEAGAGWAPRRHVLLKASWQHNWRDGGTVKENDLVAGTGGPVVLRATLARAPGRGRLARAGDARRRGDDPRERRGAPGPRLERGAPGRGRARAPRPAGHARPPAQRRLPGGGAPGRVRGSRSRPRRARPEERGLRALRPRGDGGEHGGLPEQRPRLPQRLLALEAAALRPRPLPARASRARCASTSRASCASSARSTRT